MRVKVGESTPKKVEKEKEIELYLRDNGYGVLLIGRTQDGAERTILLIRESGISRIGYCDLLGFPVEGNNDCVKVENA